jgi:predicted Zn-dependent protease
MLRGVVGGISMLALGLATGAVADDELAAIDERIAASPKQASLHLDRAEKLLSLGRFDEALDACDAAQDLLPGDGQVVLVRAEIEIAMGDVGLAEHHLTNHIRYDRKDAEALFLRGRARELGERFEDALADYDLSASIQADVEVELARARVLMRLGRLAEASSKLRQAIAKHPGVMSLVEALIEIERARNEPTT